MNAKHLLCYGWLCFFLMHGACSTKTDPREPAEPISSQASAPTEALPLKITNISFAGPAGHRPDRNFSRGEKLSCLFTITNFTYEKRKAHLQADLVLLDSRGQVVFQESNLDLIKGEAPSLLPGSIRSAASLSLHPAAEPGRYTLQLKLRDVLGQRQGKAEATFTLLGTPPRPATQLTLSQLAFAGENKAPPGAVVPFSLEVKGVSLEKLPGQLEKRIELWVKVNLEDLAGHKLLEREEVLLKTKLLFDPVAYPLEYNLPLPPNLAPGAYRLTFTIRDAIAKKTSQGSLGIEVVPPALALHCLHFHDAAKLPRDDFLLGEQIFIRFSLHGLQVRQAEIDSLVDLAIAGPDGGVYLAQKNASSSKGPSSQGFAKSGRFPVQIPIILPILAPTGQYRVVIRARDQFAGRVVVKEKPLRISGSSLARLSSFKIDELQVRDRPDLPLSKGDTFGAGQSYSLALRVGGGKIKQLGKMKYQIRIKGDLRLRDLSGKVIHESGALFSFDRTFTYQPLRILIPATWHLPADLSQGLYDLEISANSMLDDQSSQMTRRVEIIAAPPAVPLKLP